MDRKHFIENMETINDLEVIAKFTADVSSAAGPIRMSSQMPRALHTEKLEDEWQARLKHAWWSTSYTGTYTDEMNTMLPLREKLLSFGGDEVCLAFHEPDLNEILYHGQLWYGNDAKLVQGIPSECHSNSVFLWNENKREMLIATGYALSQDGMWRQHSWCLKVSDSSNTIIETTEKREAYFGYTLTYSLCEEIYNNNF